MITINQLNSINDEGLLSKDFILLVLFSNHNI
ncbi:hypothetical protein HBHAL_1449 [Halobacillus halophilus DSM 2266]|uniref:Uncharacterized protein n=2 Tax=Halobacillus halophilus TaxID=1570 RepID=I0JI53_HALH3|nr:hypothetical protein [Halobacillus halophilus DSM 2266]CCG43821.1 hypothetical protein HBHAL_1449 [Halobacillus halophilus DSM 2266]